MVPYKKEFTEEELKEVCDWLRKNEDRFPESLQLSPSTRFVDLKKTVRYYYDIVDMHKGNPTYSGQIYHVFQIQKKLKEMWGEE